MSLPLQGVDYFFCLWRHEYPQSALTNPDRQRIALQGSTLMEVQHRGASRDVAHEIQGIYKFVSSRGLNRGPQE